MSATRQHPLEEVLVAIAQAAPRPWYYREAAKQSGVDPALLENLLEFLHLEGLIARAEGEPGYGPGVALTPLGQQVLDDPEARQRLRTGEPITNDQGAQVRNTLRRPITPYVTRVLLIANLAVFGYCLWLANRQPGMMMMYLKSQITPQMLDRVFIPAGAVTAFDVIRGHWWRLLTTCFVHAGLLHILFNMYTLHAAGRFTEQTWGHWRYVLIYLIAGWAGACTGLAYSPRIVVGASGALCGILAADGMWMYLYGRHLPRSLVRGGKTQFWMNVVLMGFISFMPGISGWGHLGGALAGALTAGVLHFVRYGNVMFRVLGLVSLLPVVWYPYFHMQKQREKSEAWHEVEKAQFENDLLLPLSRTMRSGIGDYAKAVKPVMDRHPERREPEQVEAAVQGLAKQLAELGEVRARLEDAGPYRDKEVEAARKAGLAYVGAREEELRETQRCLQAGKEWTGVEEKKLQQLVEQVREKRKAWEELLQ